MGLLSKTPLDQERLMSTVTHTKENNAPTASLYEQLPYPADQVVRTTFARVLKLGLKNHAPHLLNRDRLKFIDIGCGTGEATCGIASFFPDAEFVAVDINPASLEYAQRLADKKNLNIRFVQANITENLLESLNAAGIEQPERHFDVVTSMGVLHHLAEPAQGFQATRKLISDDGLFMGYMYSRAGRWNDLAVQPMLDRICGSNNSFERRAAALKALGLSARFTVRGVVSNLRNRLQFGPPLRPSEALNVYWKRNRLTHVSDHFSNPCEHFYNYGELKQLFAETGWKSVALAEKGGLPVSPEQYSSNPETVRWLNEMPEEEMYDYFAYKFQASGFSFFLKPAENTC